MTRTVDLQQKALQKIIMNTTAKIRPTTTTNMITPEELDELDELDEPYELRLRRLDEKLRRRLVLKDRRRLEKEEERRLLASTSSSNVTKRTKAKRIITSFKSTFAIFVC